MERRRRNIKWRTWLVRMNWVLWHIWKEWWMKNWKGMQLIASFNFCCFFVTEYQNTSARNATLNLSCSFVKGCQYYCPCFFFFLNLSAHQRVTWWCPATIFLSLEGVRDTHFHSWLDVSPLARAKKFIFLMIDKFYGSEL